MRLRSAVPVLALVLSLTGCGVARDLADDRADASPTPNSAEALRQAAEALHRAPYTFQFRTHDTIGAGAVDGSDGWLRFRAVGGDAGKARLTFEVLHRGGQHLVRSNPLTGDQWTRIDVRKVDPARRARLERFGDPAHATDLFVGITSAEASGTGRYRGTLDFSRVPDADASVLVDEKRLAALTPQQRAAVPFEATVDDRQRLLGLRFTLPAAGGEPEQPSEISYSEHGFKPDLGAPFEGRIGPAPAAVYEVLNS
ncbi:hypothetical protein ABZV78_30100 [Micromonospora sp. NPDC004540]|uniref:hypothetical protein n=1 Tax=Micromonospora sp. NPDC004540 TaxID=3154457 RepID=UPI0033BECFC1